MENLKIIMAQALLEVEVDGMEIKKLHGFPDKFVKLPAITYILISDVVEHAFSKSISEQVSSFQVDIWAEKNSDISKILLSLKKKMLEKGIFYDGGNELQDPSGIKRFTTTFKIKG